MDMQPVSAQTHLGKNPSGRSGSRPPRKNRFAPKTRTGCLTCRARRIKCDEARPSCRRCIKANHSCHYAPKEVAYFARRRFQKDVDVIQAINGNADVGYLDSLLPNYGSLEEKYYLDKFLTLTAPWLSKYNDGSFFHILLPQRSWHHPALRHTLVAVAMATVQFRSPLDFTATKQHHWHHSQALHHLYTASEEEEEVIILTSAMMWLHSNLTFNSHTAMVHLQGLLRMLHEYRIKRRQRGLPTAVIESQLLRLLVFHVDVSENSSAQSQRSEVVRAILTRLQDPNYSRRFRTMDEVCDELRLGLTAISYVSRTSTATTKRGNDNDDNEATASITAPEMRTYFEKWYRTFSTIPETPHTDLILLECYYIFASLVLQAQQFGTSSSSPPPSDDQQTTDRLVYMLDRLEEIEAISLPQVPPGRDPALPISIIPTQVIVLTRNTAIRKRAYAYLRRLKRVEGLWSTDMAADMIEAIHPPEPWLGSAAAYESVSTLPSPTSNDLDAWQSLLPSKSTKQVPVPSADIAQETCTTAASDGRAEHNLTTARMSPSWNGSRSHGSQGEPPNWKRDARIVRPSCGQARPVHSGRLDEGHKAELLNGGMLIDQMMQEQTTWTLTSLRGTYNRVSAR